jgi:hypothetical protein
MPLLQPFRATNKTDASLAKWQVFRSRYIPAMLPILSYWSWPVKDIVGKDVGFVVNVWDKGYYQAIWEERGYRAVREYSLNFLLSHKSLKFARNLRPKLIRLLLMNLQTFSNCWIKPITNLQNEACFSGCFREKLFRQKL